MSAYTITYYDSMKGSGTRYMNSTFHYLQDDWHRTQGFELPELRQWSLINESSVPVQENSYDCGAFVCLFATCMAINCPMTFTQSDAPKMRLKLAHLIFTHCNAHADVFEATNHDTCGIAPSISNTKKDIHMISQDHSSQSSHSQDSTAHDDHPTGYCTIMNISDRTKCKANSKPSAPKKRTRFNTPRMKGDMKTPSDSGTGHQLRIPDLLVKTTVNEQKRKWKMDITDDEHPFKQKRYKEDDNK
jgi:hypothetical protein